MSRTHKLGAAALATILCLSTPATVTSRAKDRPARSSPHWEAQAVAGGGYLAWQQYPRNRPKRLPDVYLRKPSGDVVKLNRAGTSGALGGIDGRTLVYQEYRGTAPAFGGNGFSRIVLYDLETGKRTLPARANGSDWEYLPAISGPWIFYALLDANGIRHIVGLNRSTDQRAIPDTYVEYLQPGQVHQGLFVWVSWNPGQGPARVRAYDVETAAFYELRTRRWQWAPSIGPQGAVYVVETGRTCGSSPVIKRYPRTLDGGVAASGKEVLRLPQGFDSSSSYGYANARGLATIVHERQKCGTKWGSDIYRFSDTVSLTVTKDGSGSGTVTGVDGGIQCGDDCSETVSGGAWVTLDADAELASHFAGWSHECAASDEEEDTCTLRLDDALTVTATFDLGP